MAYDTIDLDVTRAGVAVITLDRPDKRNAINYAMVADLTDALETLSNAETVRTVFIRGAGESFSAGADLEELQRSQHFSEQEIEQDAFRLAEMLRHVRDLPQLTVALIRGGAHGAGAGLVAACDVAIALKDSDFSVRGTVLGFTPAPVAPFVLEAVGKRWAKALLMTGERFDAAFAHQIGLVHYVAENEQQFQQLDEMVAALAFAAAPSAVADVKQLLSELEDRPFDAHLSRDMARRAAHTRVRDDAKEGVAAFLEKRKPRWAAD